MTKYVTTFLMAFLIAAPALARGKQATMNKADYINKTETQLNDWDTTVIKMKAERDILAVDSDRYKRLDSSIRDIEAEIAEAKSTLNDLRGTAVADWSNYKTRIEANLKDAKKTHNKVLAE